MRLHARWMRCQCTCRALWYCVTIAHENAYSSHQHSSKVKKLCNVLYQEVGAKFPGSALQAVGSMFFLRFVCPYLLSHGTEGATPKLLMVSKVLQALSNHAEFSASLPHYEPLNSHFIRPFMPKMKELQLELAVCRFSITVNQSQSLSLSLSLSLSHVCHQKIDKADDGAERRWLEQLENLRKRRQLFNQHGIIDVNRTNDDGWTPLHSAAVDMNYTVHYTAHVSSRE